METSNLPASTTDDHHNHRAKIAIIGGGSLYCANLLRDFIRYAEDLRGCSIMLMDINKEDLELIYTISFKLFQHTSIPLILERTTILEEALEGADIVITTFRTGGLQARLLDEKIPLDYNVIGHNTIGPGGFFYALRTAPVVARIAAEIEKVAPRAFLLNYMNPSNVVTEAIAHSSGIRVIGLSGSPRRAVHILAQAAGVAARPGKHLFPRTVGLTHGNWTTKIWREGVDVLPTIVDWCKNYIEQSPEVTAETYEQIFLATLTANYEAIPSYFMYYYYFPEYVLEIAKKRSHTQSEEVMRTLQTVIDHYRNEAQKDVPKLSELPENDGMSDFAIRVLRAILNDTGEEWVVGVQNQGSLNFIDNDRVVEVPCRVDARGATPLAQGNGNLAMDQRGLITLLAEYEGATARAALWGTRRDAIKALASNPLVMSYSKAEQVYNALARAHAQYLPERLR